MCGNLSLYMFVSHVSLSSLKVGNNLLVYSHHLASGTWKAVNKGMFAHSIVHALACIEPAMCQTLWQIPRMEGEKNRQKTVFSV